MPVATTESQETSTAIHPLLVLIAGPYLFGRDGDPSKIAANRTRLEAPTLPIYQCGHLPLPGEWLALPIMVAGGHQPDDEVFNTYQYSVAERLLKRCDVVLRLPGTSHGADLGVACSKAQGLPVFNHVDELPPCCACEGSAA